MSFAERVAKNVLFLVIQAAGNYVVVWVNGAYSMSF